MSDWMFPQDDDYKHIKSEFGYLEKQANIKLLKSQPQHYWKFVDYTEKLGLCQETNSATCKHAARIMRLNVLTVIWKPNWGC